jgi:hypothetical protein
MVVVAIALTLLVAGGSLAMLFYLAFTRPQPNRVIVVRGSSEWEGIKLSVDGTGLAEPKVTKFEPVGKYIVPFFLWPGKYTLHVENEGVEVFTKSIDLTRQEIEDVDLGRLGVTTRPSTQPTTEPAVPVATPQR